MVSSKLLLASVAFTVLALGLAKPQRSNGGLNRGPAAPNTAEEMPQPDDRAGGRHGKKRPNSQESQEGSGEDGPCGPPKDSLLSIYDSDTKDQIAAIWSNFTGDTNCTDQLLAQDALLMTAFMAFIDAKAANLTDAARAVFEQFKSAMIDFELLPIEDQGALMELQQSILEPLSGDGDWGRKNGGPRNGPRNGPWGGRSAESAEETAEETAEEF